MPMTFQPIRHPVRILGIDPGLRRTGWGVIETEGNRLIFVGCGSVEPSDGLPLASRLLAIHQGLARVLADFMPVEAAVEQTFVNKDGAATLKLGQARGVAMLAPAMAGASMATPRAWPSFSVAAPSLLTKVCSTAASTGMKSASTRARPWWIASSRLASGRPSEGSTEPHPTNISRLPSVSI